MLDILASYLSEAASSELKDAIERAHNVFDQIQLPDYESAFEELIHVDGDSDRGATVGAVATLTRQLQDKILAEHLVVLHPECPLDDCTQFIEGLLLLPTYEDAATIHRILEQNLPTEEVMAELMELVTPLTATEWLVHIESVSYALVDSLRGMVPKMEDEGSGSLTQLQRNMRIRMLSKLLAQAVGYESVTLALIARGMDMGYPFALYSAEIGHNLEALDPNNAAVELLVMCIVSSDAFEQPVATLKQHMDHFVSDADVATRILVRAQQLMVALQQVSPITKG